MFLRFSVFFLFLLFQLLTPLTVVCNLLGKFSVVTDFQVETCLKAASSFRQTEYGFPYCTLWVDEPNATTCPLGTECIPGWTCNNLKKCVIDESSCFKYYTKNVSPRGNLKNKGLLTTPTCLENGDFAPKQCKGGQEGRCFCYDSIGNRVFGQAFLSNEKSMTCACSTRKAKLLTGEDARVFVGFHCDEMGNFEELQCDSGHCWCSSPDGNLTSAVLPEGNMAYLSCAKSLPRDSIYLRKCESKLYSQSLIIDKMKKHGITQPNIAKILCLDDGSYGPYFIKDGQTHCVTPKNAVSTFHGPIDKNDPVNCNCYNDKELFQKMGKDFSLDCSDNGNYVPVQVQASDQKLYCVDKDGYKKIDIVKPSQDLTDNIKTCHLTYD